MKIVIFHSYVSHYQRVNTRKTHRISLVHELETAWTELMSGFRVLTGFSDGDVLKVINTLGPDRSVRTVRSVLG